ncbi:UNVERIFIED_CONTAM: hypothetical protein Sindi_1402700 [Sesamum indicum]
MGPSRNMLICLTITHSFFLIFSSTNAQKPQPETTSIPYKTVNSFCLHKRLNVNRAFCLRVLKSPASANAKPNDFIPLLQVAINSTSSFICKTLTLLQNLYDDEKTTAMLIPAVNECLSAYEEIAGYITYVISDASQESAIAGLDGEVIKDYIGRCIKALAKTKEPEIADRNKEARNYAKLLIDIADNLRTRKPK